MKGRLLIVMIIAGMVFSCRADDLGSALAELDEVIVHSERYDNAYAAQIDNIKRRISAAKGDDERQYMLNHRAYELYQFYMADSAMKYAEDNIAIAHRTDNRRMLTESHLQKVDVLARSGLFHEAMNQFADIDKPADRDLQITYYLVMYQLCQYASEYAERGVYESMYFSRKLLYADSILSIAEPNSFVYNTVMGSQLIEKDGNPGAAIDFLHDALLQYHPGVREYSVITSQLASAYLQKGDSLNGEIYVARSALSDVMASVKENVSMRMLADMRYRQGDIRRAHQYVTKSLVDANFYSARMRNLQSATLMPIVNAAYSRMQADRQSLLKWIIMFVSIIALIIVCTYVIIRKQYRKLSVSHSKLEQARNEVVESNRLLQSAYESRQEAAAQLEVLNSRLQEANSMKDTYLSQFIWLCSSIINKMESFRNRLFLLAKTNQKAELQAALTSTKEISDMSGDFYRAFDEALLAIKPDFISKLNSLLKTPIQSKGNTSGLTTDQRIFALIRLGITDNQKIADFLHCSITTVYTYRSKIKMRAKNPDTFDNDVMSV